MEVTSVVDKMRKVRLRWFGLVHRRCVDTPVTRCESLVVGDSQWGRDRSNKYWGEVIS